MKVYLNDEKKSVDPRLHLKRVGQYWQETIVVVRILGPCCMYKKIILPKCHKDERLIHEQLNRFEFQKNLYYEWPHLIQKLVLLLF